MSYTPTEWKSGDTVTSAKLNKIEQGIAAGGGILIAHIIDNGNNPQTLDKTWQEIHDADICYIINRDDEQSNCALVIETKINKGGEYAVNIFNFDSPTQTCTADSPNGTLIFEEER